MKYLTPISILLTIISGCAPISNPIIGQQTIISTVDNQSILVQPQAAQSNNNKAPSAPNANTSINSTDILINAQDSTVLIFSTNQYHMDEAKDAFWFEIASAKPVITGEVPPIHWEQNKFSRVWRQGSGVIIDQRGYIITDRIVVEDCVEPCGTLGGITTMTNQSGAQLIYVFLSKNGAIEITPENAYIATVICKNPHEDIAILKITPRGRDFPYLHLGNSNSVQIGNNVRAIGYLADILYADEYKKYDSLTDVLSFNLDTLSKRGTISTSRKWDTYPYNNTMEEQTQKYSVDVFQVDFEINRGNCGGPLINQAGEMIGLIITKLIYKEGIGHAIAINETKGIIAAALTRPIDGIPDGTFLSCNDNGYCCNESAILSSPEKQCEILCNRYYSQSSQALDKCYLECKHNTH